MRKANESLVGMNFGTKRRCVPCSASEQEPNKNQTRKREVGERVTKRARRRKVGDLMEVRETSLPTLPSEVRPFSGGWLCRLSSSDTLPTLVCAEKEAAKKTPQGRAGDKQA